MRRTPHSSKPSLWVYYATFVLLTCASVLAVTVYASYSFRSALLSEALDSTQPRNAQQIELAQQLNEVSMDLLLDALSFGVLLSLILGGLGYLLYRGVQPPLREMRAGAERFAKGEFDQRLPDYHLREIAKLAMAMNKMGSQLHHLEEVRSDFVANVSHELKTPITSIKGFVETLLDGALDDPDDLHRFLEIIGKQAERLTLIIEDLLTLARLESGSIEELLVPQEESVHEVLQAAVGMCRDFADTKDISIDLKCDSKLCATFDRSLLEQAVGNLVGNAIKYSGPSSCVSVRGDKIQDLIEISVSDQGPGIAEEHLPRLFERFYRVDKARTRKIGGTGLGLAIVKHIAGVHHGNVEVRSELGKGSTFFLRIPKTA